MFLVTYDNELDSIFFHELDAKQYIQNFSKDQDRFEMIEIDDHRSDVIASIMIDVNDNYRFCKATGLVE